MLVPMLFSYGGVSPQVDPTAYVQSSARVIGDVHIGSQSSVWFNTVVRGDVFHVRIGARTNLQDNSTVHVTTGRWPTIIGDDVTIGHGVVLHGCNIGDRCLVGIGAVVLDGCEIGNDSMIAAGSLVTPGSKLEPGHLMMGSPARITRALSDQERRFLIESARNYVETADRYRAAGI